MLQAPSPHAIAAMAVTIAMFIAFARGRYREEIISLVTIAVIAVGLYFAPLPDTRPTDGLALAFGGFGHSALITICALMIMGRGLVVTGALEPFARVLEGVFRVNPQTGLLTALLVAFTLSMFVNDTPVMVLLIPIIVAIAAKGLMPSSKILMPVNTAVLLGGMATTIGTSTNILVVTIADDLGMKPIGVFQFTPIVLMAALIAIPYLWLVMPRMLRDNSTGPDLAARIFHTRLRVGTSSVLAGGDLSSLGAKLPQGITIHNAPQGPVAPGQGLHISGSHAAIEEAARALKGELAPGWIIDRIRRVSKTLGEDIVAVEMTVTADSRLLGRTLAGSAIADLYRVAVLGIHRPGVERRGEVEDVPAAEIRDGDVLLAIGLAEDLDNFARSDALLRLEGARELPRRSKAVLAGAIMLGAISTASIGLPWVDEGGYAPIKLPIAISALAGAILMFVSGCVVFDRVGRALSAKVIVLIAASLAIGRVIDESGAAAWLGQALSLGLGYLPPALVLAAIMLFVTVLTNFASNATAATIGTPIAYNIAGQLGLPPEPMVLAVLFGCNLSFATPIAYQTNLLIMSEGGYNFGDYVRAGTPLVAIMVTVLSVLLVLWYGM
ncbi:MAG: SLC13 family permease [Erythrobacter sp.]|nr:SLC13 family permease [Erythrobacter sp.]